MDLVDGAFTLVVHGVDRLLTGDIAAATSLALGFVLSLIGSILLFVGALGSFAGRCLEPSSLLAMSSYDIFQFSMGWALSCLSSEQGS